LDFLLEFYFAPCSWLDELPAASKAKWPLKRCKKVVSRGNIVRDSNANTAIPNADAVRATIALICAAVYEFS